MLYVTNWENVFITKKGEKNIVNDYRYGQYVRTILNKRNFNRLKKVQ
jgi:hypothetical protein